LLSANVDTQQQRIKFGVCKTIPRQIIGAERSGSVVYKDLGRTRQVHDSIKEQAHFSRINPWSDMEKCIFIDKFCR